MFIMKLFAQFSLTLLLSLACEQMRFNSQVGNSPYTPYTLDTTVENGEPLALKRTTPIQESLNLSKPERSSIITITAAPEIHTQTIKPAGKFGNSVYQTGKLATTRTDTREAIIDIAIVMDESTSISLDTLESVANKLSAKLAAVLTGSKWKIAVTGSSKDGGYFKTLDSKSSDDHAKKLYDILVGAREQGTKHWNELVVYNAVKLINNQNWQRTARGNTADAQAIILITDEDLQCERNELHTFFCEEYIRESERLSKQWKAKKSTRSIFGIIKLDDQTCTGLSKTTKFLPPPNQMFLNSCYNRTDSHQFNNQNYLDSCTFGYSSCYKDNSSAMLIPDTGINHLFDLIADIHAENFDNIMAAITEKVKEKTLTVNIPGKPFINSIAIGHKKSNVSNLVVKINNRNLPQNSYRVADYKITLNTASSNNLQKLFPPEATLFVSYDFAGRNRSFALPQSSADNVLLEKSVAAFVNGRSVGFSINGRYISLNAAPPANAKLTISARYLNTVYDLAQQAHRIDGGNTICMKASSPISCIHSSDSLRFDKPNQIAVGDTVIATQKVDTLASSGEQVMTLNTRYLKESIQLKIGGKTCSHDQLTFVGNTINLSTSSCSHLKNLSNTDIVVDYRIYDNTSSFNLDVPESMIVDDNWDVQVAIKDKTLKAGEDYVVDTAQKTVHFLKLETIDYDSTAVISYTKREE